MDKIVVILKIKTFQRLEKEEQEIKEKQ